MPVLDIYSLSSLLAVRPPWQKVVHCHGVFDIIHIGHMRHFASARQHGSILVVTVTPDCYVGKGPNRPIFTDKLRAEAVAALRVVDYVAVNLWPTAVEAINLLRPDCFAKGEEYRDAPTERLAAEKDAVEKVGGRLVFAGAPIAHSTEILEKLLCG